MTSQPATPVFFAGGLKATSGRFVHKSTRFQRLRQQELTEYEIKNLPPAGATAACSNTCYKRAFRLQIYCRSVTFTAGPRVGACMSCDHSIVLTIPWAAMSAARVLLPEVPGVQSDRRTSWPPTSVRSISINMASACSALSYSTTPKPRTGLPSS